MAQTSAKRTTTPPKGRPTRKRNGRYRDSRAFGPTAQWIAGAAVLVVAFIIAFLLLDGGDFNPFNDETTQGTVVGPDVGPDVDTVLNDT